MTPNTRNFLAASLVAGLIVLMATSQAAAQRVIRRIPRAQIGSRQTDKDEDSLASVFLPADRQTMKKLADARKLIAEERYGEAVGKLGALLDAREDFFFRPDDKSTHRRGLKAEADRLLGELPPAGREAYELQYGARAGQELAEALDAGDVARMADVSRRFFHTVAGRHATFLVGLNHVEHGRPLAGALVLDRLLATGTDAEKFEPRLSLTLADCWLWAGRPEKAKAVLVALRSRHPNLKVSVGGRDVPIFTDDAKAIEWLVGVAGSRKTAEPRGDDDWRMFGGDVARNTAIEGSEPLLNLRWRVDLADDPQVRQFLTNEHKKAIDQRQPWIPALHPLAIGDTLLMRTTTNLVAVDLATGKRLWEAAAEDAADAAASQPFQDTKNRQSMLAAAMRQRVWSDLTFGTLASDGRCVFSIEDLTPANQAGVVVQGRQVIRPFGGQANRDGDGQPSLNNRLAAHEIRTGKLKWQVGGPLGEKSLRLAGAFFLGPPLPLAGQLYVLAEIKHEIRLLALDAATGDPTWSQQLGAAEPSVAESPDRRWSGVSPSYADGVLVCPILNGVVVGVDLAARSLLWGNCYATPDSNSNSNPRIGVNFIVNSSIESAARQWADGIATIRQDRVLLTPTDSESLYCLRLEDGKLLWKTSPKDESRKGLYVACADRERVVVVGRSSVWAVRLADGGPAWNGRRIDLPIDAMPSGRGLLIDVEKGSPRYLLPLTTGEVASIDTVAGAIVRMSRDRKGTVPGNLIGHRGKILSQGIEGVDAFWQLNVARREVDRRLAANPNDAKAMSLRGEVLLDSGKRAEAIASFERAYRLSADARTRNLLRETIFEGLDADFAAYRGKIAVAERLLDHAAQRATLLRLTAEGLRRAGESIAALEHYQKLIDLEPRAWPLDAIDKTSFVRRDVWVGGQLAELRAGATAADVAKIDAAVAARRDAALAESSSEPLTKFFDVFGRQPAAAPARAAWIERLKKSGRLFDAELADDHPPQAPRRALVESSWPTGRVEARVAPTKTARAAAAGRCEIEMRGDPGPFLRDLTFQFDVTHRAIIAIDTLGRERWQVALKKNGEKQDFPFNPTATHAQVKDHLLLVSLGARLAAIDASGRVPRLLWIEASGESDDEDDQPQRFIGLPWPLRQQPSISQSPSMLTTGIGGGRVCFQRLRDVVALDVRDGKTLWSRHDMPMGSEIFGDDQYLFVLPAEDKQAIVLSMLDGRRLGTRGVPRQIIRQTGRNGQDETTFNRLEETCLATFGRKLLLWWPDGNHRTLTLVDPWEGRDMWPGRDFSGTARACLVDGQAVGVLEPSGRFTLVSLPDGREIANVKLEAEPSLMDVQVFAHEDRYLVLTHGSPTGQAMSPQPMPGQSYTKPIYRGRLYAIDRHGKLLWPKPTEIKNQFAIVNQPADFPVLVFGAQVYRTRPNGQARFTARVLCVDKRNGRIAFKETFNNSTGVFRLACGAAKDTIELVLQQKTVTLAFTDKPPLPEVADTTKKPQQATDPAHALWKAIQRVLSPDDDDDSDADEE